MQITNKILSIIVLIGCINWGLIGIGYFFDSNLNIISMLFGNIQVVEAVIYIIVGFASVFLFFGNKK